MRMADPLRYAVVLEPAANDEGGGYVVSVLAFPEAHSQGDTLEACLNNAREVIELCILARRDLGEAIPASDQGAMLLLVDIPAA